MSTDYCLGIDLGTTNTLCAVWVRGEHAPRLLPISQPMTAWTREGFQQAEILPSAVCVRADGVYVGKAARDAARRGERDVYSSIKRHMGTRWSETAAGSCWTPQRISGCILKAIANEVASVFGSAPLQVVVTVPASFDSDARRATLEAAALAGFDTGRTRIFDEPSAALLHQLNTSEATLEQVLGKLLIVDIGGGTLDVSLLDVERNGLYVTIDIQGRSRYHDDVAGDDFDLHIAGLLLARYEKEFGRRVEDATAASFFSELLARAEDMKCLLSERTHKMEKDRGRVIERADFTTLRERVSCYRTPDLQAWSTDFDLNDLSEALRYFFPFYGDKQQWREDGRFFKPIIECLDSVEGITGRVLAPEELTNVYLAGGSAQLPMVATAVQRIVHQRPRLVARPMQAVALGAGWLAGLAHGFGGEPPLIKERLYDGIYMQMAGGEFSELLSPREEIPVVQRRFPGRLSMAESDLRIEVQLFTGNRVDDPDMQPLARRRIDFRRPLDAGHPIELVISVDENRRVDFEFLTVCDGQELRGNTEVSAAIGWVDEHALGPSLPAINIPTS